MGHLEGNFTPVLYIGRKVPKGEEPAEILLQQGVTLVCSMSHYTLC